MPTTSRRPDLARRRDPQRLRHDRSAGPRAAAPVLLALTAALLALPAACRPKPFDRPAGAVLDSAGLLAPESTRRLERLAAALLEDLDLDLALVTFGDEGRPVGPHAERLFERWEVGGRSRGGRGLLVAISPREQRVSIVVGYELEAVFPDALVAAVERDQTAPWFARGRAGEGLEATVELLARHAYEEIGGEEGRRRFLELDLAAAPGAGGAGAESSLAEGGPSPATRAAAELDRFGPQPTPADAWGRFVEAHRRRIASADLGLYDPAAREVLVRRPYTEAAQDHVVRLYDGRPYEVRERGDRAAIVFPDDPDRLLAPWFFRRYPAGWRLDGGAASEIVGYNHLNQWRFRTLDHPYAFAFESWSIDRHGFARPPA